MWEYSCRRLQPPTGDPKVSTETIWGRKLSASLQTISIPSPLLCFSSKFSPSLSLLSDSTNPNVTAHSNRYPLLCGFYEVTWFKCRLYYSRRSCKMTLEGTKMRRKRCQMVCIFFPQSTAGQSCRRRSWAPEAAVVTESEHVWRNHSCSTDV